MKRPPLLLQRLFLMVLTLSLPFSVNTRALAEKPVSTSLGTTEAEKILTLSEEELDIATAVLTISRQVYKDVLGREFEIELYRTKLDEMAQELSQRIGETREPEEIIRIMNDYLFKELGFSVVGATKEQDPHNVFLNLTLDDRRGECLTLSIFYLALAERLGLPFYGVAVPSHFFVRYEKDGIQRDIETTYQGNQINFEVYQAKSAGFPKNHPFYMRSLNKRETIGIYLNNVATFYSNRQEYEKAIAYGELAKTIVPFDSQVYSQMGNTYMKMKRPEQALLALSKALELNSSNTPAYINLGTLYEETGMPDKAISLYNEVIAKDLSPDVYELYAEARAGAYVNRGVIYKQRGSVPKAVSEFNKALKVYPQLAGAYYNLGAVAFENKEFDRAIPFYRKTLEIEPNHADAHVGLGASYAKKEMIDDAIKEFEQALAIDSQHAKAHYNLALLYFLKKRHDLAVTHCDKAMESGYPASPWFLDTLKPYRAKK